MIIDLALAGSVRLIGALSLFCLTMVVAHRLEADEAGYFFLGFNIVIFLSTAARVGLDQIVLRLTSVAQAEELGTRIRQCLVKALGVAGVAAVLIALCLWLGADWLAVAVLKKPAVAPVLKAIAPSIVGCALLMLIAMSLQGIRRISTSVFVSHIALNLLVILFLLTSTQADAVAAAHGYSVMSVAAAVACFALWRAYAGKFPRAGAITLAELTQSCMPLWIFMLMSQLVLWSGQIMAGAWVEPSEIALLSVAQRTAMVISFAHMAMNLVIAPKFAELYSHGKSQELEKLALRATLVMVVLTVPVAVVILLAPQFIMSLFGEFYSSGATLLQILTIGQLINVVTGPVNYLLTMCGHDRDMRNVMLVTGPTAVILGLLLIPTFGAAGCAVATTTAIATQNILAAWLVKQRLGFNTLAFWR
ncbi:MAG: MATE family efflux transporter [Halioglobus sp.]|nr:MATE family efflux transporter [Halioglobus sp.]